MRILYLGDIVGEETVKLLANNLEKIKQENKIHVAFANAENVCGGKGLNFDYYKMLMKSGLSVLSMGNHTFSKFQIYDFIDDANIVRPANLYNAPGKGYMTINYNNQKITVINLIGRVFMNNSADCPFRKMDEILENVQSDYYIVDFHAEATSEKIALANYLDGRITAIVGTHTHVQTADERRLPKGTLAITDLGMCGPINSILGEEIEPITDRFITGIYKPAKVASGVIMLNGVIIDTNTKRIERFHKEFIKEK